VVLQEDMIEVQKAEKEFANCDGHVLRGIISHHFCIILLNKLARHVEKLLHEGVLTDKEAHHILADIDKSVIHCSKSDRLIYPGNDSDDDAKVHDGMLNHFMKGMVSEMTLRGHVGSAFKKKKYQEKVDIPHGNTTIDP